ncbi:MAG: hypothetical protein JWN37_605 [Candidatus Nomurabacteria bacterium]|nr:hypothetical protein [Candidatus Nomurabacteria bacterium]
MSKIPPEKLANFKIYRDHINKIGNSMPMIFQTLGKNIHSTQKYRFILTIIMGTEVIKIKLRGLIILDDYINELRWYLEKFGNYEIKKMNEYALKSYGQTLNEFNERYNLEKNDNNLYKKLYNLNKRRNDTVHNAVIKYEGDIQKADEEIRPYILTQALDDIQKTLTNMINLRAATLGEVEKELREKGLF